MADAKSALARAHAEAATSSTATPMAAPSKQIAESLAILQSGNVDAILARDYGPQYGEFNRAVAEYKAFKAAPRVVTTYSRWGTRTTDGSDAAFTKFSAAKLAAMQAMSTDLAQWQQRGQQENEQDHSYQIQAIQDYQERVDRMTAGQGAAFAAIDNKLKSQLDALAQNPLTGVDEVFQWAVTPDAYPTPIYAGVKQHYRDAIPSRTRSTCPWNARLRSMRSSTTRPSRMRSSRRPRRLHRLVRFRRK